MGSAKVVTVKHCAECPFSYSDIEDESDEWTCTATENRDGFFRAIGPTQPAKGEPFRPPPKWCPLRKSEHVIRLEVAS